MNIIPSPPREEQDALERLDRVRGAGGMRAALLALLLVPEQPGRLNVWQEETSMTAEAERIRLDSEMLGDAARLPWMELLLARLATTPLAERRELLRAARRMFTAARPGLPIDTLQWLAIRRHFGDHAFARVQAPADAPVSALPPAEMAFVTTYTAHLARMVPNDDPGSTSNRPWYEKVMARWLPAERIPAWRRPDVDALVSALHGLQAMSWMQRPQIVRAWVEVAMPRSRPGPLPPTAADALRLSCGLMDTPIPPELARQYLHITSE